MNPKPDQARIQAFIAAARCLNNEEADALFETWFPPGDPSRERALNTLHRTRQLEREIEEREIGAREDLGVEGHEPKERIGQGGNGFVYLARQRSPDRLVAVKYLRGISLMEARKKVFEIEMAALTLLQHRNIVEIHSGGTTATGRPYFVMRYVEGGKTIVKYACDQGLTLQERLRLFLKVCKTVQFAHEKLVLHRDLKPSNILVDSEGEPVIIDFGISKMLCANAEEAMAYRMMREQPMDSHYSSPELRKNEPVGVTTDVFSLGLTLAQLLTSTRMDPDMPVPPSEAQLSAEIRRLGFATEQRARKAFKGDLDAIVMKAVDALPARRYATAGQLAEDIERFLTHRPVAARESSWAYRAALAVRRNPWPVALVVALLVMTGLAGWGWILASAARVEALRERDRYYKSSEAFRRGMQGLSQRIPGTVAEQNRAVRDEYWRLAKTRDYGSIRETMASRARELTASDDPQLEEIEQFLDQVVQENGSPSRGGGAIPLPKGPSALGLLALQLEVARVEVEAIDAVSSLASLEQTIGAARPLMQLDAERAGTVRSLVCGAEPIALRLRALVKTAGKLCAP